jgi:HSP20 family molecular chaperone IbpA
MKRELKSAGKLVVLENSDPISAATEQIQNRIRERAYELSQLRGHSGRDVDDWLLAESVIMLIPAAEMIEKDGTYKVQLAIAGVNAQDVNVMSTPDHMLVRCEFRHEHNPDSEIIHLCDFKSATVFRSIHFPQPINLKSTRIQCQDGMMIVTAEKQGAEQAVRKRQPSRKLATRSNTQRTTGAA